VGHVLSRAGLVIAVISTQVRLAVREWTGGCLCPFTEFLLCPKAGRAGEMAKDKHEIRDPIHVFIRLDSEERKVVDSPPFQRLRHIHQLGLTYLLYPGATHKRFEHSLGVMELASRVFDVVTRSDAITDEIRDFLPEIAQTDKLAYWKRVIRMAALCHDLGHLPFSHAAEKDLLPSGWSHERLTKEIIRSAEMKRIWERMVPPLNADHIVKLAVGKEHERELEFSDWETVLSEIIVGDAFGVDRIDYLLRDSHHAGVGYGKFDHYRLIDTLRILTPPPAAGSPSEDETDEGRNPKNDGSSDSDLVDTDLSREPTLGIEEGGLHSAEALLLARYFMFTQVYLHPIRRIYDLHLKEFLKAWCKEGHFSVLPKDHISVTDNEVTSAMVKAAFDSGAPGHAAAHRIINRKHFKVLYSRNPEDIEINAEAADAVYRAARDRFGEENLRLDSYIAKDQALDFPVLMRDDRVVSSMSLSQVLTHVPSASIDYVFVKRDLFSEAQSWLGIGRERIIQPGEEDEEDDKP